MILTGRQIADEVKVGRIKITPFVEDQVTTNSYDLRLGSKYIQYTSEILDPKIEPKYQVVEIPEQGLLIQAGEFLLAETEEKIGSDFFVPIIHAKSGIARLGLFVHITADLIDIGSFGKSTLQLYATLPVKVYPRMLIAQVSFWKPLGEIDLYKGKYQHSDGPRSSLAFKDFK